MGQTRICPHSCTSQLTQKSLASLEDFNPVNIDERTISAAVSDFNRMDPVGQATTLVDPLPTQWQLLSIIMAVSGLFAFGWSTAVVFIISQALFPVEK